jgi:hypothetical protein
LERPFTITVSSTGAVTPTVIPKAGVSGEHNATTLNYSLAIPETGIYKYNIEIQSGLGEAYLSEFITPSDGATRVVSFSIPSAITRMGAADFCLIETKVDALGEIISITKSAMTRCIFTASPNSLDDLETSYSGLLQGLLSDVENIYDAIEEMIANAGLYFNRPNFIFDTLAEALAYTGDGYIIGSTVQTRGYYVAGDNGGALYEIKANDTPDGIFSYEINNDLMLSIIIENNEVRVDQLGAKKDAVHNEPTAGDLATLSDYFTYCDAELALNASAFDGNAAIIEAALLEVGKVTFTPGEVYPITNLHTTYAIDVPSNVTIDGCGAYLKHISKAHYNTFYISVKNNVVIKNINFIGTVYDYTSAAENKAIKMVNCSNITIDRVRIIDYVEGIKTQQSSGSITDETLCNTGISITDCRIERVIQGWQANALINSTISNLYISCKINELVGQNDESLEAPIYSYGVGNHCIYAGSHIRNCQFSNLVLRDAYRGSAFKREYASTPSDESGNISMANFSIYNCRTAIYLGNATDGCTITNVTAYKVRVGILLSFCKNITIDNCVFTTYKEDDLPTTEINGTNYPIPFDRIGGQINYYACMALGASENVKVSNCLFDTHHCLIYKIDPTPETLYVYATHDKTSDDYSSIWADGNASQWTLTSQIAGRLTFTRYWRNLPDMPATGTLTHVSGATNTGNITYTDVDIIRPHTVEDIQFFNCDFRLEKVYNNSITAGLLPFAGTYITDKLLFDGCRFFIEGFGAYPLAGDFITPKTTGEMATELSALSTADRYSFLFFFGNNTANRERDYFTSFKNCRFESAVEINSVFVDYARRTSLHLKVENCTLKGFRLIARRSTQAGVPRSDTYDAQKNPAFSTYPTNFEAHSIYMDSLDRFLSSGNIYEDYSGLRPYQFAESYGISNLPVYNDITINAVSLRPGASPPSFVEFVTGIYQIAFVNGNTDIVYGSFEIPHGYKEGTDLEVHIHWSPSSTDTGNCVFNFDYTIANMGTGVFGAAAQKTLTAAGSGVALQHQYATGNTAIDGDDIKIGDVIVFALSRPAGDAFTGDAFLHSIGLHYECDTLGSRAPSQK